MAASSGVRPKSRGPDDAFEGNDGTDLAEQVPVADVHGLVHPRGPAPVYGRQRGLGQQPV